MRKLTIRSLLLSSLAALSLCLGACMSGEAPTDDPGGTGDGVPADIDPGGDGDGDDGDGGDDGGGDDGDGGGAQSRCVSSVQQDGVKRSISCTSTGGASTCECRVDDVLVKTCSTPSASACSIGAPDANCCGF